MTHARRKRVAERGMATLELAIGLLTLGILTVFLGWAVYLGIIQAACSDTATQVARHLARGDESAAENAKASAPAGAVVSTSRSGSSVLVVVRATASWRGLWEVPLEGAARYVLEPGE